MTLGRAGQVTEIVSPVRCSAAPVGRENLKYLVLNVGNNVPNPETLLQGLLTAASIPPLTLHSIHNVNGQFIVVMERVSSEMNFSDEEIVAALSGYIGPPA